MAYRDENGKITIDERAASRDVKRLTESAQMLKDSREAIRSLQRQAADMQGETANAIISKAREMDRKLTEMIDKLETSASFIKATVQRYELLDEQIKRAIQSAASIADANAAASNISSQSSAAVKQGSTKETDLDDVLKNIGSRVSDLLGDIF